MEAGGSVTSEERANVEAQLKDFAKMVKDLLRLQLLDEDCTDLRREVYLLAHKYS